MADEIEGYSKVIGRIATLVGSDGFKDTIKALGDPEIILLIDLFLQISYMVREGNHSLSEELVLSAIDQGKGWLSHIEHYYRMLVRDREILPPRLMKRGVPAFNNGSFQSGGFGDVYKVTTSAGESVAVKIFRVTQRGDTKLVKQVRRTNMRLVN